jgi:hypothetical protein
MTDHWERLRDAVVVLAGGGPVKQRLTEAYQGHLRELDPEDLPRELRPSFEALLAALQNAPRTGSLDAVSVSVRKMSEAEAAAHSQCVVRMFADLQEPAPGARTGRLRAVPTDDGIPAFLNRA